MLDIFCYTIVIGFFFGSYCLIGSAFAQEVLDNKSLEPQEMRYAIGKILIWPLIAIIKMIFIIWDFSWWLFSDLLPKKPVKEKSSAYRD